MEVAKNLTVQCLYVMVNCTIIFNTLNFMCPPMHGQKKCIIILVFTQKNNPRVNEGLTKTYFYMIIISRCKPDLPRSNKNIFSDVSIIPDNSEQCQGFRSKRIENVRLGIIDSEYDDFVDEIIGEILAAGGENA